MPEAAGSSPVTPAISELNVRKIFENNVAENRFLLGSLFYGILHKKSVNPILVNMLLILLYTD